MTFGDALALLKQGKKVARSKWESTGLHLELQVPDQGSKMKNPYIYVASSKSAIMPWTASHADLLQDDWTEVK
jgi:hypothetical protein